MGLGHVVRSLALAEMLHPDFTALFAIREPTPALAQQIKESNAELLALPAAASELAEAQQLMAVLAGKIQAVVLDGYHFSTAYQRVLRQHAPLVCLADYPALPFVADVIINPAGGVAEKDYAKEKYTQLYSGPAYALLRAPFLAAATQKRSIGEGRRFFLNLGGADPENHTQKLLQELVQPPGMENIAVVVGSAYRYLNELADFCAAYPQVTVHAQLSAAAMCRLMQTCQAAILPPSSVAYEWCAVGGPLFLVRTASNQKNLEQFLLQQQLAYAFADFQQLLPAVLAGPINQPAVDRQRLYFDGQSPGRLRKIFHQLLYPDLLRLRAAQPDDRLLLFNWINEPAVRQFSLNPAPVPLAMHTHWYQHKLTDQNCFIFIAEMQGKPVGMIRFDISNQEAMISYLLDSAYRGQGLGTLLLQKGTAKLRAATTRFRRFSGLVQTHNPASIRAFEKAGFSATKLNDHPHSNILKFTRPV